MSTLRGELGSEADAEIVLVRRAEVVEWVEADELVVNVLVTRVDWALDELVTWLEVAEVVGTLIVVVIFVDVSLLTVEVLATEVVALEALLEALAEVEGGSEPSDAPRRAKASSLVSQVTVVPALFTSGSA